MCSEIVFSLCTNYYSLKEIATLEQVGLAGPPPPEPNSRYVTDRRYNFLPYGYELDAADYQDKSTENQFVTADDNSEWKYSMVLEMLMMAYKERPSERCAS